ncbi:MAG: phospholipase D-like domain-containing protein, partial [Salinirussus sp.]
IHAKGVIVDGDRAVVGSLNWNNHSARENREVALVLQGEAAGRYFTRVFRADWRGGRWTVPLGVLPVCALAVVAALRRARGIEFVGRGRTSQQTPQPVSRHSVEGSGERQPEHHLYAGEQDHYSPVQGEEEALARQQRSEEDG